MNIGFIMLTDYSEAVNGKLYLAGGGWNVLRLPEFPHEWSFHIGLGIDVAWHETNSPHELSVTIQDPDGMLDGSRGIRRIRIALRASEAMTGP